MWRYVGIAAILAIACILPFAVSGYRVSQFSQVLIYAIAMLGLNILTGYAGQLSLDRSHLDLDGIRSGAGRPAGGLSGLPRR